MAVTAIADVICSTSCNSLTFACINSGSLSQTIEYILIALLK